MTPAATLPLPDSILLRPYAETDPAAARELHAHAFERLAAAHHGPAQLAAHRAPTATAAYATDLLASSLTLACGGCPDAAPVTTAGWIGVPGEPGTARIRKVFVHPSLARQGLASRLVLDAERRARAAGYARLVVRANANAVPLYRRLGYRALREGAMEAEDGITLPVLFMEEQP